MTVQQKTEAVLKWLLSATEQQRAIVVERLVAFAIEQEYISVFSEEDKQELKEESDDPDADYNAPYYTSCGEPIYRQWD